ncbi:hypothetical protein SAMN04487771_101944 [[Clostridium] aminophilum]|uniref:Uncharacterized protein n=1 Tax=[Clostridium] aminophilum TaxID=1526 RepID=A0A1I0EMA8_9FIRM|nr:hypothetical protein [[Clostridium] aminophilum]SET46474.1 hypothetical protein SAMN04487771_101944 [[Clostridium] aminophilum]
MLENLIDFMSSGQSLADAVTEMLKTMGLMAIVLILVMGFLFFIPTIIASFRQIRLRVLVCALNVLVIATVCFNPFLPAVIWLCIMIIAIAGKREAKKTDGVPAINIITSKDDVRD